MGQLYANIAIGFDIYGTFFPVYIIPIIEIGGSAVVLGWLCGFYYKYNFGR